MSLRSPETTAETLARFIKWPRRGRKEPVYGVFDGDVLIYWCLRGRRKAAEFAYYHGLTSKHIGSI